MRVETEALSVRRGDRTVVTSVSIRVESGGVLGVVGPNGSGKSSLLRAIAGLDDLAAGRVLLDGTVAATLSRRERARRIAVMSQEHGEDFEIGVREMVLLGRIPHHRGWGRDSERDLALAEAALDQVGARALADRRFGALSGGERQRILLARALAQDSPVLILDEPTNHLDIAHQLELLDLVAETACTVLIALHDLNLAARSCDQIAVLAAGHLRALGSPEEVLNDSALREIFGVNTTPVDHPVTGARHLLFDSLRERDTTASL